MWWWCRLKEKERLLAEKDRAVWALESDIVGLQGRCTIIQHEFTRIRELETVSNLVKYRHKFKKILKQHTVQCT